MNVGDVVQLKSGGPCMTVVRFIHNEENEVYCGWFDLTGYHTQVFPVDAIYSDRCNEGHKP